MKTFIAFASTAAMLAFCAPASAAMVTVNYVVDATNFQLAFGDGSVPPIEPVHLDVTLSFDDSADFEGTTNGMTVNSFNLPYSLQYAYMASSNLVTIATFAGAGYCYNPPGSFCSFWVNGNSQDTAPLYLAQRTSSDGHWEVRFNPYGSSAVPEPASWAMMIGGFALAGTAMRSRKAALRFA